MRWSTILWIKLSMRRGSQTVRQRSAKSLKSVRLRSTPPFFLLWSGMSDLLGKNILTAQLFLVGNSIFYSGIIPFVRQTLSHSLNISMWKEVVGWTPSHIQYSAGAFFSALSMRAGKSSRIMWRTEGVFWFQIMVAKSSGCYGEAHTPKSQDGRFAVEYRLPEGFTAWHNGEKLNNTQGMFFVWYDWIFPVDGLYFITVFVQQENFYHESFFQPDISKQKPPDGGICFLRVVRNLSCLQYALSVERRWFSYPCSAAWYECIWDCQISLYRLDFASWKCDLSIYWILYRKNVF